MIGGNYHIQDYLKILCKFIYVSYGKFLNIICLSILILGVFRSKQETGLVWVLFRMSNLNYEKFMRKS
jgi:hypothetical protein